MRTIWRLGRAIAHVSPAPEHVACMSGRSSEHSVSATLVAFPSCVLFRFAAQRPCRSPPQRPLSFRKSVRSSLPPTFRRSAQVKRALAHKDLLSSMINAVAKMPAQPMS